MGCFDSQVIRRMTAFVLDDCGKIPAVGTNPRPALKGIANTIQTVQRTRNVTQPTVSTTKVVTGRSCSKPLATPTDNGFTYQLTFCGANPVFESAVGYTTLKTSGLTITGWDDAQIAGQTNIALEIIFQPSASACAGGSPQCRALLVPLLQQWVSNGNELYNGSDVPDLQMTGTTVLNANVFSNYGSGAGLPSSLAHWSGRYADIAAGDKWGYSTLITCPAEDTQDGCHYSGVNDTT